MSQKGIFALLDPNGADFSVVQPGVQTGEWIEDLDGMLAITWEFSFSLVQAPGQKIQAYLQTSLDQGSTAVDIGCITATTTGKAAIVNLSGLTPRTTELLPTDGSLPDDTFVDGVLGDRLRLKVIVTGNYGAGSLVQSRISVR